jgi:hypothetical protein
MKLSPDGSELHSKEKLAYYKNNLESVAKVK